MEVESNKKIKIFTLGRFLIVSDGKPIEFMRKLPRKQLALLKALIAREGRDVDEIALCKLLWKDIEGDYAHHSLATTLYRLRKLLGEPRAIRFREGQVSLDSRYCWVDAWDFNHVLMDVETLCRDEVVKIEQYRDLYFQANALYQGNFLADEKEQTPVISLRDSLQRRYQHCLYQVGIVFREQGHYEIASNFFQQGLELNEFAEECYWQLMICYAYMERRTDAIRTFNDYFDALLKQGSLAPAYNIKELYHRLRNQDIDSVIEYCDACCLQEHQLRAKALTSSSFTLSG